MREKKIYGKLYVASRVYHIEFESHPWVKNNSFGEIEHNIYVSCRKILVYTSDIDNKYYLYPSGKELLLNNDTHSYLTKSTYNACNNPGCMSDGVGINYNKFWNLIEEHYTENESRIDCIVSVSEYFGIESKLPPTLAYSLVKITNLFKNINPTFLSYDEDLAKEQLKKMGKYYKNEYKKIKKLS